MKRLFAVFAVLLGLTGFGWFSTGATFAQEVINSPGVVQEVQNMDTYPQDGECQGTTDSEVCFDATFKLASAPAQQVGERFLIWFWRVGNQSVGATFEVNIPKGISTWGCSEGGCTIGGAFNGQRSYTGNSRTLTALVPGSFTFETVFTLANGEVYTRSLYIQIESEIVRPSFRIDGDTENWSPGRIITHTMVIESDLAVNATFYYGSGSLSSYAQPIHNQVEVAGRGGQCNQFNYKSGYWWCEVTLHTGTTTMTVPYLNTSDYSVGFYPVFMLDLEPASASLNVDGLTGWYNQQSLQTDPCAQSAQGQGAQNWVEGLITAPIYSVVRAYGEAGYAIGCAVVNGDGEIGWFGLASGTEGEEITFTIDSQPAITCPEVVTRTSASTGKIEVEIGATCVSSPAFMVFLPLTSQDVVVR